MVFFIFIRKGELIADTHRGRTGFVRAVAGQGVCMYNKSCPANQAIKKPVAKAEAKKVQQLKKTGPGDQRGQNDIKNT